MGRDSSIFELGGDRILPLSAPLTVVAADIEIARLRDDGAAEWLADATLLPCPAAAPLPLAAIGELGVIIVEIDPLEPSSFARIKQLRDHRRSLTIIAALARADLRTTRMLVREGVADVIELPFSSAEILETLLALSEDPQPLPVVPQRLAPMTAVVRAIGGQGATSIASHLAAELAGDAPRGVCVIDLDIQTGRMADVFGLTPRRTLADLLEAGVRLDAAVLRSVAIRHASNVYLVAAPLEIAPIEAIEEGQLLRLLDLARREYDHVVVDLPANFTNWTLAVLARADALVPVVQQSLASLHQTRRMLDLFAHLGLDGRLALPVVNRVEKKLFGGIGLGDVRAALGREICAAIASEPTLAAAQDQGLLLSATRPKSPFLADIQGLAGAIARGPSGDRP